MRGTQTFMERDTYRLKRDRDRYEEGNISRLIGTQTCCRGTQTDINRDAERLKMGSDRHVEGLRQN